MLKKQPKLRKRKQGKLYFILLFLKAANPVTLDLKSVLSGGCLHLAVVYFRKEQSAHHYIWTIWKGKFFLEVVRLQDGGAPITATISGSVCRGVKFIFLRDKGWDIQL